ncbi:MAG: cbb3-type cytochrome c oxidase subunit I, partial [Verrucomicrobia bacterium]|nr:cbb3-type cytochrome c oxidase subunit I [Verrucomicrobiota bacterium]
LIFFGTWIGIPAGAPVPAWLPTTSQFASYMLIIPVVAVAIVFVKTLRGNTVVSRGAALCYFRSGTVAFFLSAAMLIIQACPKHSGTLEFTWFGQAQVQLQILGFAGLILCGAINYILPLVMGKEQPFKTVSLQFFSTMFGVLLLVVSLAIGGVKQGNAVYDPTAAKFWLMISTTGTLLVLIGALMMFANIFVMTFKWKIGLAKAALAAVKAPLENPEVKA